MIIIQLHAGYVVRVEHALNLPYKIGLKIELLDAG